MWDAAIREIKEKGVPHEEVPGCFKRQSEKGTGLFPPCQEIRTCDRQKRSPVPFSDCLKENTYPKERSGRGPPLMSNGANHS
jgi:hypothetical protein